ncbi:MAG: AMP-binding protein [Firmicutes bacterium]|nr:AMP-binding protein [Bacillota bacterium]
MNLLGRFLDRTDFSSYDDFKKNYKLNIPDHFNFGYDVVDVYAKEAPEKLALIRTDDTGYERRITFGEMKRLTDKTANALRLLGVEKGDKVLMILKQREEAWITIVALIKLGAVCIPATFQLTPKDVAYRCEASGAKLVIAVDEPEIVENVTAALPLCPIGVNAAFVGENVPEGFADFRKLVEMAPEDLDRTVTENDDMMLMYFSSGTTGMPKMVAHDYTYPLGHIVTAKYWQHVQDDGIHLTVSDSGWAKFAWGKIFGQWIAGTAVVGYDEAGKFNPHHLLGAMERLKLTTFCAPPTIYRFLIKEDMSGYDFSTLRYCCTAGEPLNPEVVKRFGEQTGLEIHEGFGQSETSVILANFGWDPIKPGSTGKPSPLYDIDIVDENGESCDDGIVGSIVIKNASSAHPAGLFKGYYNDEDAMSRSWVNGVYNTGDMAWRDSDGYFWFEGRGDDVIKCSGYRIGPFEVESALLTHPAVLECAVTAVPDPIRGQVVKATIVLTKGRVPSEELKKELQNHVKHVTAPYKYPRVIEFVSELPKTTSGKIKRAEIRRKDNG